MKKTIKLSSLLLFSLITIISLIQPAFAEIIEKQPICVTYITGIGCPHCAKTDPLILKEILKEHPELFILEYEVYQQSQNAEITLAFDDQYNTGFGIPKLIFSEDDYINGDIPILDNIEVYLEREENQCPLAYGREKIENIDFTKIEAQPKIWRYDRVLFPTDKAGNKVDISMLLIENHIEKTLKNIDYQKIAPINVPYSGGYASFENAAEIDGWILEWNDYDGLDFILAVDESYTSSIDSKSTKAQTKLTIAKLLSLAAVDAVNPCALAVLTLMLIAILAYHPDSKKKVLYAGLAFSLSVFIMYLIYGLVIIKFFQLVQAITSVRLILYKILGVIAIVLGILNIKDVICYRPGGFATEMPMIMRGKLKKLISGVTSPKGAFFVGLFVTIFLLPCTIGPYVIAGGILSTMDLIKTIPSLLLYNFVFILPMLVITGIVYFGMSKVENVSAWKDKNIKYLHLFAGIIMLVLGILMFLGLV